jgi:hypothetical protein
MVLNINFLGAGASSHIYLRTPALFRALKRARMDQDRPAAPVLIVYPSGGMAEDAGRDAGSPHGDTQRVTISEAARIFGVMELSIRKFMQRGTLDHDKGEDGRTYVYLDAGILGGMDAGIPGPPRGQKEHIEELKDQIGYLREQLAEEREARRRADTIIAQLTQANATLAALIPELEAPTEPQESPERASEGADKGPPAPPAGEERRSWWRRIFGP